MSLSTNTFVRVTFGLLLCVAAVASVCAVLQLLPETYVILMYVLFLLVTTALIYEKISRLERHLEGHLVSACDNLHAQTEAMLSLTSVLEPCIPFPATRGWAGSPDFLREIATSVLIEKPHRVLEASSGLSTLIIAYSLKKNGLGGRVLSFDHNEKYAAVTRQLIEAHGLGEYAEVVHAPLVSHLIDGENRLWYDYRSHVTENFRAQMLVIDGPPVNTQSMARFPALPLLLPYLESESVILLDDSRRESERQAVKRWQEKYEFSSVEYLALEKGCFFMRLKK